MRKTIVMLLVGLFVFAACEDSWLKPKTATEILTSTKWRMRSLVNYSTNNNMDISSSAYRFNADGTFTVIEDNESMHHTTWELFDDDNYLRIGSNTFKIKTINENLLGLRYGQTDIFYVPVD